MKFTDGNWLVQPGIKAHYPAEAYEVKRVGDVLEVYAPTKPIRHRGDTLEGPVLTVRLSSPMNDVIRVRISHFEGQNNPGPEFEVHNCPVQPQICSDPHPVSFTAGRLKATLNRQDWSLEFEAEDRKLTKSPRRGMGYICRDNGQTYVHEQLSLGVGEYIYGLGERFTAFVKNGQVVDTWNRDGGTGSEQAYKNIPFYLTNHGYGVFVNQPEKVSFEVASERVSRVQFSVEGESLEYFVIYGPSPKEILQKYTALTGRPALPPAWSFGLWLSTSFTTNYDEATVSGFLDGMASRDLPLSVFHFDCFWMRAYRWCDFEWDPEVFPDPEGMLQRLRARGLKVCVWINPYIAQRSPLFEIGKKNGYLLKRPDGSVWQWDLWQPGMAVVDFTNPAACDWYAAHLKRLMDMGVDSFKTDFGERIPAENVAWFDGSDPQKMHNYYAFLFNKVAFEALKESKAGATVFARAATAGSQQFPVHWGGDNDSSFESMAESLRGGLSLGLSGFGFWSHDIGGFEGKPPTDLYKRWVAFGLLSSHSRLHGSTNYRVPWLFDEEAVDVLRHFTKLKYRLMPYFYQKSVEASQTGVPVMRAMLLEFPHDPNCAVLDRQYMLGESLLVAPVFSESRAEYYLPEGKWTHLISGEQVTGPKWVREELGFAELPLWVRSGSLLATGSVDLRPDYDFGNQPVLTLYALEPGQTAAAHIPTVDGLSDFSVEVEHLGQKLRIKRSGTARPFVLRVAGTALEVHLGSEMDSLEVDL